MPKRILVIAGEASGDLHGGPLIEALYKREPDLEIFGIGGNRMQSAGMTLLYHVQDVAFIGFAEIVKHLGTFKKIFDHLVNELKKQNPDLVILIDYPGFNLRFGKKASDLDFPVFYYIAPQVWAWRRGRAKKMAKFIDRMAVIFDFEVEFFSRYGIDTHFVGHPLLDGLHVNMSKHDFFQSLKLDPEKPLLALLPGSRKQEIENLLPVMLDAAKKIKSDNPNLQIAVSRAATISGEMMTTIQANHSVKIVEKEIYELMSYAQAAIVASGTATLETACLKTPFIIVYRVAPLSFFIGKRVVKLSHIGLANIVAGEQVAKEFIQHHVDADNIAKAVKPLLFDDKVRRQARQSMGTVREKLGQPGAAEKTAELVLDMINE